MNKDAKIFFRTGGQKSKGRKWGQVAAIEKNPKLKGPKIKGNKVEIISKKLFGLSAGNEFTFVFQKSKVAEFCRNSPELCQFKGEPKKTVEYVKNEVPIKRRQFHHKSPFKITRQPNDQERPGDYIMTISLLNFAIFLC